MKKWVFLLYLLGISLAVLAKEENPLAIQAENLYKEGNYAEAVRTYEELLKQDKESFRLFY
ncbi:MAG: hypothetical protein LIO65_06850, partial [Odoribacter sp.]|nr:hypothetical protein [Odoribacter sp.]